MAFFPALPLDRPVRVGVNGTGFIARGLLALLAHAEDFQIGRVLTRRRFDTVEEIDNDLLTDSITELVSECDLVVECGGNVGHAAEVVEAAFQAGRPVVTMATEFHVTVGSYYCGRGYLTEAEGDQPGSLAALAEDVAAMGFSPLVFGNIKGFLNHHPLPEEMEYWSERNGISVEQTVSFTDGTKMQMEQALVANGLGAGLARRGMLGLANDDLMEAGMELGRQAKNLEKVISDYVISRKLPAGVFVVAEHAVVEPSVLRYLKLGEGPYYTLLRPFHLCHLEIIKTLRRVVGGRAPLLNNTEWPRVGVLAVSKQEMAAGTAIKRAFGGYQLRGEAALIAEHPEAVPLGLLDGARLLRRVEQGEVLTWADVEIVDSTALKAALLMKGHAAA